MKTVVLLVCVFVVTMISVSHFEDVEHYDKEELFKYPIIKNYDEEIRKIQWAENEIDSFKIEIRKNKDYLQQVVPNAH